MFRDMNFTVISKKFHDYCKTIDDMIERENIAGGMKEELSMTRKRVVDDLKIHIYNCVMRQTKKLDMYSFKLIKDGLV